MSQTIRLKKGFDIKIKGAPKKNTDTSFQSKTFALKPTDFKNISPIPKVVVESGDEVLAGDPIFFDKKNPDVKYCSPVSGEVVEIRRGAKRAISEVVILGDSDVKFRQLNPPSTNASREDLVAFLLESGAWPFFVQRPYGVIADHKDTPRDIFVSGFDSSPLSADISFQVVDQGAALQAGFDVLKRLTTGKVYLGLSSRNSAANELKDLNGVNVNYFDGPHPAGNVGVQIHHIAPINKGDIVWTLNIPNLIALGRLFSEGKFNTQRLIAVGGPEVKNPQYYRTYLGANIEGMLANNLNNDHVRVISGNPLSGKTVAANGHIGMYDNAISVLEEGDSYEPFGWLWPSYDKPTISRSFLNGIFGKNRDYNVNTNSHGEHRAFVVTGQLDKVLPMDIYPLQLIKSILVNDFDQMEGLGIYEVIEEDLALCEYVCTSKSDLQSILKDGLNIMIEQG